MSHALVVLSGGQDSTTCLYWALQNFDRVSCVTFDYAQKHRAEIDAAVRIAKDAGITEHEVVELGPILAGTSPLTDPGAELEQYDHHSVLPGGLEKTFVPGRNLLFLTLAANRAYVLGARNIITGVCQEDFGGYPDCRRSFIDALEVTLREGLFTGQDGAPKGVAIHTPLMDLTKAESVDLAVRLKGCYAALAYSHTSYDGQYPPTGHDHATLLRQKGFEEAGIPDPLILRAFKEKAINALPKTDNYKKALVKQYMKLARL